MTAQLKTPASESRGPIDHHKECGLGLNGCAIDQLDIHE
jgi:hypothetical protein